MTATSPSQVRARETYRSRGTQLSVAYFRARENLFNLDIQDVGNTWHRTRDNLAEYCLRQIKILVRALVYGRCWYPRSCGPHIFADECISKASEKYVDGIDTLESPERLHAWLRTLVRFALIDELWHIVGQGHEEREMVPLARKDEEGDEIELLEEDKGARDAAFRYLPASILLMIDADEWLGRIANRELLEKALEEHAQADPESASWVNKTWEDPELTVQDIAQFRACSLRTVYRLLRKDNKSMVIIAKRMSGKKISGTPPKVPAA